VTHHDVIIPTGIRRLPLTEAFEMVAGGRIRDAVSIMSLQAVKSKSYDDPIVLTMKSEATISNTLIDLRATAAYLTCSGSASLVSTR
jgi:hypothetical protein